MTETTIFILNSTMDHLCVPHAPRSLTKGQIQVIFGPMFSGKTTELMRRLRRYQLAAHSCLVIKYAADNRYDSAGMVTHDKQIFPATSATSLEGLRDTAEAYTIIGIDEGQFFPDTVEFAEDMANRGKTVIVAALDGTFQRKGFGNILQLVPLAESVVKLSAVCTVCYQEAHYTKRTSAETALEVIGGSDKYIATCRKCYFRVLPLNQLPPPDHQALKAIK
ncbi:thymidine kinase, cytosolic-like [Eriocheir sinensis]|uniref:thymidine kinase, cytosolic-like n=1 Tax=Eriocheir sinensis TaxID=95602 RepID=UPI0021C8DBFA|nr:thymidine kinase, cytosolic-like [Eriocheir sinensis]